MRCISATAALALAVGVILTACSESRESSPTEPSFKPTPSGFVCNLSTATSQARAYFAQPTQGDVVALVGQIGTSSTAADSTARVLDVFEKVAAGVDVVGTALEGSALLNAIGPCGQLGQTATIDWTGALGAQGGFAVRGGSNAPVISKDQFSAVAPPTGKTWSAWLGLPATGLPDARAVVYGAPFTVTPDLSPETEFGARGFDWSTLPVAPNFPLTGDGALELCVGSSTADRIQNNHVGSIPLNGVLGLGGSSLLTCNGFDANGNVVTSSLFRRVIDALAPQPLYAAAFGTRRTVGTPGGFSKSFVVDPTAITLTFGPLKDGFVNTVIPSFTVTATTGAGVPMQNITISIINATNNGVPAQLDGPKNQITNEFGVATFSDLILHSAGGYVWHVTTSAGTDGIGDATQASPTFHIKNKK
jgi:hypothetical protein